MSSGAFVSVRRGVAVASAIGMSMVTLTACGSGSDAADGEITVKYINNSAQPLIGLVGDQEGFFKDAGVQVKFQQIDTGTEAISAMIGGSADFVTAADARVIQSVSKDLPIEVVGLQSVGFQGNLVVRADNTSVQDMADLKGKKIGIQVGSGVHTAWLRYLDGKGLSPDDFKIVNLNVADMPTALESHAVDGALMWQPDVGRAVNAGLVRVVMNTHDIADAVGILYPFYLLTTKDVIDKKPEEVQRFMDGWVCSQKWVGANPDAALAMLAKAPSFKDLEEDVVKQTFGEQDYAKYLTVDDAVQKDMQGQAEKLVQTGAIDSVPDLAAHIDSSFAEKAADAKCGGQ